jgi:hypothetical protein
MSCGLPGAVGPEYRHDLALAHLHRRLPEDLEVAVGDVEASTDSSGDRSGAAARNSLVVRRPEVRLDHAPVAGDRVGGAVGDLLAEDTAR